MTLKEAKYFLEKMATHWEMPAAEKQAFLAWQQAATAEELQILDRWHRQFLLQRSSSLDMDTKKQLQRKDNLMERLRTWESDETPDCGGNEEDEGIEGNKDNEPNERNDRMADNTEVTKGVRYFKRMAANKYSNNFYSTGKKVMRMAAIVLLILGCFYVLNMVLSAVKPGTPQMKTAADIAAGLPPGSSHAVLTLANGTQIFLDSADKNVLQFQNGNSVKNLNGNLLSYSHSSTVKRVEQNRLSTPRGGQYQVQLPDGTHVWLNSASSLVYPTAFVGPVREVQLTGEAYFEVSHNAHQPFIVHTHKMEVEVLGTGFNIMAYPEEKAVRTTLVHGAVLVKNDTQKKIIKPGEQATLLNNHQSFDISKVDVSQVVAWKTGEFWFKNTGIKNIMRQLSRWYDFEVQYQGDVSDIRLSGVLAKRRSAEQLLRILESTRQVTFEIHEKTITIQPAKGR